MANTNNFPANPTDGQTFVAADGVSFIYDATNSYWNFLAAAGGTGIAAYSSTITYVTNDIVYNTANGIIYRSITDDNRGNAVTNVLHWLSLGGATQFTPNPVTSTHFDTIGIPNDTVGANLILSKNNLADGLSPTPNRSVEIFGTGGINVTAHGARDVIQIDGSDISSVEHVLDLETVFSFTDGATSQELVGYVNLDVFDNIRITATSGVTGVWTIADHALVTGNYYVVAWASSFAVGIATAATSLNILRYHVHSGDSAPDTSGTGQAGTVVTLENVQPQNKALNDLSDVNTAAEDNVNNVLFYNPTTSQWFASDSFTKLVHSVDTLKEQINLLSHSVTSSTAATRVNDALRSIVAVDNNPADDAEYDYVHNQLLWRVEPTTNSNGTFIEQAQAANAYREAGGVFAVAKNALPDDAALVVDANDVYYFRLTGFQATGSGSNQYNVIAQLIDITGEDQLISDYAFSSGTAGYNSWFFNINNVVFDHMTAVDVGSGIVGITQREADLLGYLDVAANTTNNGDYLTIDSLGAIVATDAPTTGADTALRTDPDTVATDSTWTSYITKLGFSDHLNVFSGSTQVSDANTTGLSFTVGSGSASGLTVADTGANVNVRIGIPTSGTVPASWDGIGDDIPSGAQFPDVANHTPGDLFMLTAGHTQPADDDLIYVGLYTLVENTGAANEWVHLTEYKTAEVELNYPGGSENVTLYGNKGVEDLAQDLLDTTALVYNNMNQQLALKSDITTSVIDTDIGLNASNEVTSINVGGTVRNLATGSTAQFPSVTQWLNSLTAPTGATIVVDNEQITYTPSGGSPVVITFLQFIHPVGSAIDQDVDAILVASGYAVSNEFYINGEDKFYYVATTGNHLHLTIEAVEIDDLSDVVIANATNGQVLQYNEADGVWRNATSSGGFTDPYVNGVTQDASTGVITTAGGNSYTSQTVNGVWNNFRYATLLTTGFLLTEGTTTGTVDEYTDTNGIVGASTTSYFFQNSNDTWYDTLVNAQAAGATGRLIAFPA